MARAWLPIASGGMVVLLIIANLGYCLGPLLERLIPSGLVAGYRRTSFALGFWLSALVPFIVPGLYACSFFSVHLPAMAGRSDAPDIPGTYLADYGLAKDTVVLAPNGKFVQTVKVRATGKVASSRGTWTYDPAYRQESPSARPI